MQRCWKGAKFVGKNKDGLVWKSDVVKKLQEHVGVPAKVWAATSSALTVKGESDGRT